MRKEEGVSTTVPTCGEVHNRGLGLGARSNASTRLGTINETRASKKKNPSKAELEGVERHHHGLIGPETTAGMGKTRAVC